MENFTMRFHLGIHLTCIWRHVIIDEAYYLQLGPTNQDHMNEKCEPQGELEGLKQGQNEVGVKQGQNEKMSYLVEG